MQAKRQNAVHLQTSHYLRPLPAAHMSGGCRYRGQHGLLRRCLQERIEAAAQAADAVLALLGVVLPHRQPMPLVMLQQLRAWQPFSCYLYCAMLLAV